ncbi:uncharacterized protein [Haliotis cracherodii]|uniref:uncharacterized protein n=1 Tax=Haliotis cracherodii TaxID=6455 RepID=UPI0039E884D4
MDATTAAYVMIAALFLTVSQGTPGSDLCREVGKVDPRGFYPRECYSILSDEGDCLFDRVIPQEECLAVYGEDRYRLLINFQNDLNACYNDPGCTKLPTID